MNDIATMKNGICPRCSCKMVMIEYSFNSPNHYDGISEYACANTDNCYYRIGRWCKQVLERGESEPPYCNGDIHPKTNENNQN